MVCIPHHGDQLFNANQVCVELGFGAMVDMFDVSVAALQAAVASASTPAVRAAIRAGSAELRQAVGAAGAAELLQVVAASESAESCK